MVSIICAKRTFFILRVAKQRFIAESLHSNKVATSLFMRVLHLQNKKHFRSGAFHEAGFACRDYRRAVACCRRKQTAKQRKRREINPRPTIKGVRAICSYSFSHALLTRYSVLHLSDELSGGNEPPLCKGRWLAQARRRDCKNNISSTNNPSAAFGVSSLYTREPLGCASRKSVCFS